MSENETLATVRGKAQRIEEMFRLGAARFHPEVFIYVHDGTVDLFQQTDRQQVMTHATFDGSYFEEVEGNARAILPSGTSPPEDVAGDTEDGVLDFLSYAATGEQVEMQLQGDPDEVADEGQQKNYAEWWRCEGGLNARIRTKSPDALDQVPWSLPNRWTDDGVYISRQSLEQDDNGVHYLPDDVDDPVTPPTVVETTIDTLSELVEVSDFLDVGYYPIVVEDGTLQIDFDEEHGEDTIWGEISAESVDGPDVSRDFELGFPSVVDSLSGTVRVSTAPSGDPNTPNPPLVVVKEAGEYTVRHVVAPYEPPG